MKKIITILWSISICCNVCFAQDDDKPAWTIAIDPVTVTAKRLLHDIGIQKTKLDTVAMRDNITSSLADVLTSNSTIFIKSYGRATLSTASFRGTAPSHTQVTWNGMKLNSPMLGMVDFSLIPSYFIDDANLYHGASSIGVTGGGIGGAITLTTMPTQEKGINLRYIQGISSFNTYDEFLRLTYGGEKWKMSTRIAYSTSDNDFKYTNYRKKNYITNDKGEISGYYYPEERNKNGSFRDLHILQEAYYRTGKGNHFGISAWYMNSKRGVPMLNVDYKEESQSKNEQKEETFRGVANWDKYADNFKLYAKSGYTYTDLLYRYLGDLGNQTLSEMIHSQSYVHTVFAKAGSEYYIGKKWLFTADIGVHQHFVNSIDQAIVAASGQQTVIGYNKARLELTGFISAKWRPFERLGIAANLREESYGSKVTPVIPAGFVDFLISKRGNILLKASIAKNYRCPTLNDLYFMPGGNPDLKNEDGFTYDGGVEFTVNTKRININGEVTAYNSDIKNWIVWLPTPKGFWSPKNVKRVNSYGMEIKVKADADMGNNWRAYFNGNFAWTRSINHGDPVNWADQAIGKQLVYIPQYSSAFTGKLSWKTWAFTYKWCYYSERFTTSSNEAATKIGLLKPYFMSDISLEKTIAFKWANLSLKGCINNLFNEEYESVLSRPMAKQNYSFFIGITPVWNKK